MHSKLKFHNGRVTLPNLPFVAAQKGLTTRQAERLAKYEAEAARLRQQAAKRRAYYAAETKPAAAPAAEWQVAQQLVTRTRQGVTYDELVDCRHIKCRPTTEEERARMAAKAKPNKKGKVKEPGRFSKLRYQKADGSWATFDIFQVVVRHGDEGAELAIRFSTHGGIMTVSVTWPSYIDYRTITVKGRQVKDVLSPKVEHAGAKHQFATLEGFEKWANEKLGATLTAEVFGHMVDAQEAAEAEMF